MNRSAFFASVRARASGIFGTSLTQSQVDGREAVLNKAERRGTPLKPPSSSNSRQTNLRTGGYQDVEAQVEAKPQGGAKSELFNRYAGLLILKWACPRY